MVCICSQEQKPSFLAVDIVNDNVRPLYALKNVGGEEETFPLNDYHTNVFALDL